MRLSEGSGSRETVKLLSPSPRHPGSTLGPRKAQSMVRGPGECAFYVNRVGEVWGTFGARQSRQDPFVRISPAGARLLSRKNYTVGQKRQGLPDVSL